MVREFTTLSEIEALDGYSSENLVVVDRYQELVGPYEFFEEVAYRLLRATGKPCGEGHKGGWAVRSKDGSIAIVGGECALTNFGAGSHIARDMTRATNALDELKRAARLKERLSERDSRLSEAEAALRLVLGVGTRISDVRTALGEVGWRSLEDMARTGSSMVKVEGVRRPRRNKDGDLIAEGLTVQISIGAIKDIAMVKAVTVNVVADRLREIIGILRKADQELLGASRSSDLKRFNAALSDQSSAIADANRLAERAGVFASNDFTVLCYAVSDRAERYKLAKIGLRLLGNEVSSERAKTWISENDGLLKARHGVDRLVFGAV